MLVSSVSPVRKVNHIGLPTLRGMGPTQLLSVLFESKWAPKRPVSRKQLRNHLASMAASHEEEVADDLEPLGWGVISWLRKFRVSVRVCGHRDLCSPHGPFWGGLYRSEHRAVTLREGWNQHTAIHEMAHALDHALGVVCLVHLGRDPGIAPMLWHGFARQREGFVSDYASKNPAEYFAESFAAVFDDEKSQRLARLDPGMHAFTTAIVALSNMF